MIATHAVRLFNARLKQSAILTDIPGLVPAPFVCSKTVEMRKPYWSSPTNAADVKKYRELAKDFVNEECEVKIPDIEDPTIKQILIPGDNWRNDDYYCLSPVSSIGLIHEMTQRLNEQKLPGFNKVVQPQVSAWANHGDLMVQQHGRVKTMRRGLIKNIPSSEWKGDFVQLTARCERMNVSAGLLSTGWPAITAIGGFAHVIERETQQDIEFAFGLQSLQWVFGVEKCTFVKGGNQSATVGRSTAKTVRPC